MRPGRPAIIALSVTALLGAVAFASVLHVRPGDLAIVTWRGGGTPDLRPPGFSLRLPGLQTVHIYPQGVVTARATLAAASREGSSLELPYVAKAWLDPQALLSLHRDGGKGGAASALGKLVEAQLVKAAAATGTYDLASGAATDSLSITVKRALADRLGPRLEISLGTPILPAEVRASFEREAIYGRRVETGARIVLVGIDGADWDIIDELAARGRVPNLARLKKEGAWARLRSNVPTLSPLLWTTVATGKAPDKHGINDFLVIDPRTGRQVPINSTFRRAKAFWNILTEAGLSCDVIAWWATWPAETVKGHIISDRVAYSTFNISGPKGGKGAVFPEDYAPMVDSLRVLPDSVTHAQISRFLHISRPEFERARAMAKSHQGLSEADRSIDVMMRVLAATETYRRVALDLLDRDSAPGAQARLLAVYFEGVDEVSHRFAHCSPPHLSLCPDSEYVRFKDAVAEFYAYQDEILGEILRHARGATVIVMSDHGFVSGGGRPKQVKPFIEGKPGLWHDLTGMFVASGPLTARGEIPFVTLYDIAPTLLHLLGLPVPEDMPGKVLQEALSADFVSAHTVTRVPSYEGLKGPVAPGAPQASGTGEPPESGGTEEDRAAEEEIREQLRALGYIGGASEGGTGDPARTGAGSANGTSPSRETAGQSPPAAPGTAPPAGVPTLLYHTNLGSVYLAKKQYEKAESEFQQALRIDPQAVQALAGMAMLEEDRGNLDRSLQYFQSVVRQDKGPDQATLNKIAELFIRLRKPADGVAYFQELEPDHNRGDQRELGLRVGFGMLYSALGRPKEAEAALLRAIAIEPTSIAAMQELFPLYDAQGRSAELQPLIREALKKNPRSAMHLIWSGLVSRRQGDLAGAESALKKAAEVAPEFAGAMANLGSLYLQQGRLDEAETVLRKAVLKDNRNPEARTNLIVTMGMKRNLDEARGLVKDAEGMGQRVPMLYNALAYALHFNGRDEEALETLRESLRIDPRGQDALRLRTEIEAGHPADQLPYR